MVKGRKKHIGFIHQQTALQSQTNKTCITKATLSVLVSIYLWILYSFSFFHLK